MNAYQPQDLRRTRIAPTPSGYLHWGNGFSFIVTQELARLFGLKLLLRIDDGDAIRVRPEYVEDIFVSLDWLGIACDEGPSGPGAMDNWSQLTRCEEALEIAGYLLSRGQVYACSCSRSDRHTLKEQGREHCEHRSARPLDPYQPDVVWRWRVPEHFMELVAEWPEGPLALDLNKEMPDPVLRDRDGSPAYQLLSLSDDLLFDVDLIVRGMDLLPSSACQTALARAIGKDAYQRRRFVHHPLISSPDGTKLSKSAGATSLKAMREGGGSPEPIRAEAMRFVEELMSAALRQPSGG
ncbi:MAG: hypothetical protein KDB88_01630 [Flavobacteriales bacterium]|nr:hypothetical protein [Flavobacteriales bacterium]